MSTDNIIAKVKALGVECTFLCPLKNTVIFSVLRRTEKLSCKTLKCCGKQVNAIF